MRDKIGVIQNKNSLLNLIGQLSQLENNHYAMVMRHIDYQFDKTESPIVMFENNHMILIEGSTSDEQTRHYIYFNKSDGDNWLLKIGEKQNMHDHHTDNAFVYFLKDGSLRRNTVQKLKIRKDGKTSLQTKTTECVLIDNTFEVIGVKQEQPLVRIR